MKNKGKAITFLICLAISIVGLLSTGLGGIIFKPLINKPYFSILSYVVPIILVFIFMYFTNTLKKLRDTQGTLKGLIFIIPMLIPILLNTWQGVQALNSGSFQKPIWLNVIYLIVSNLCIGVFEELLFRNIILNTLYDEEKHNYIYAIVVSSILFSAFHIGNITIIGFLPYTILGQLGYTLMLGIFFAAVYIYTNSLYTTIIIHAILDASSSLTSLLIQRNSGAPQDITLFNMLIYYIIILPAFIVGIILIKKLYKRERDNSLNL